MLVPVGLHLKWVNKEKFKIENPPEDTVSREFIEFIWIDIFDEIKDSKKIVFSTSAIDKLLLIVNDAKLHKEIFKKQLETK